MPRSDFVSKFPANLMPNNWKITITGDGLLGQPSDYFFSSRRQAKPSVSVPFSSLEYCLGSDIFLPTASLFPKFFGLQNWQLQILYIMIFHQIPDNSTNFTPYSKTER